MKKVLVVNVKVRVPRVGMTPLLLWHAAHFLSFCHRTMSGLLCFSAGWQGTSDCELSLSCVPGLLPGAVC